MIPSRLYRVVPQHTTPEVEARWQHAIDLHRGWECVTYRDPLQPHGFPRSSGAWDRCMSGAQLAGLVRLEVMLRDGGIYIDSDVDVLRSLEPLRACSAFAAWEDRNTIPDAVIGAEPNHPAIDHALRLAMSRIEAGAWLSGPGATTDAFRDNPRVLVLPPAAFYPYHYTEKHRAGEDFTKDPWCFGVHRWAASWLTTPEATP